MIIPPAVERKHAFVKNYVDQVGLRVRDIVSNYCEEQGYAFLGRIKETGSLAEKLEGGRYAQWSDVDDLYACAVIIPTLSDEPVVIDFLQDRFHERSLRARAATRKDPDVFRFDATRFIGSLRGDASANESLSAISFEVQIRTAFEHAWSVSTHALAYKGKNVGWRHKRLAAQLRASVEQLDQVVMGFQDWAGLIKEQSWQYVDDQRLIVDTFTDWVSEQLIPAEASPDSWVRFAENLYSFVAATMKRHHELGHATNVTQALAAIRGELQYFNGESFPRSISLLQFCVGVMCKSGLSSTTRGEYRVLLTDELKSLYPEVGQANFKFFDFELDSPV